MPPHVCWPLRANLGMGKEVRCTVQFWGSAGFWRGQGRVGRRWEGVFEGIGRTGREHSRGQTQVGDGAGLYMPNPNPHLGSVPVTSQIPTHFPGWHRADIFSLLRCLQTASSSIPRQCTTCTTISSSCTTVSSYLIFSWHLGNMLSPLLICCCR